MRRPLSDPARRLFLTGAAAAALSLSALPAGAQTGPEPLPADQAAERLAAGELILIDVRTPAEWSQTGIAEGAHAIDMRDPAFLDKLAALREAAPDRPVALICATGGRSTHVARALASHGVTDLYNIPEGMLGSQAGPGWLRRGLPVEKP